jgi:hypothetical protein
LPDTFRPSVPDTKTTNKKGVTDTIKEISIHYGCNMDIVVICSKGKQLSKDNLERLRILIDVR